jgi:hypothetical protein
MRDSKPRRSVNYLLPGNTLFRTSPSAKDWQLIVNGGHEFNIKRIMMDPHPRHRRDTSDANQAGPNTNGLLRGPWLIQAHFTFSGAQSPEALTPVDFLLFLEYPRSRAFSNCLRDSFSSSIFSFSSLPTCICIRRLHDTLHDWQKAAKLIPASALVQDYFQSNCVCSLLVDEQ